MIIRRIINGLEGPEEHVPYLVGHALVTGNGGTTNRAARWVRSETGEPQWTPHQAFHARTRAATPLVDRMVRGGVNR